MSADPVALVIIAAWLIVVIVYGIAFWSTLKERRDARRDV